MPIRSQLNITSYLIGFFCLCNLLVKIDISRVIRGIKNNFKVAASQVLPWYSTDMLIDWQDVWKYMTLRWSILSGNSMS